MSIQQMFLGTGGGGGLDVSEVFSTDLWSGITNTDAEIENDIDLDGEGGLIWMKRRNGTAGTFTQHVLFDSGRSENSGLLLPTNSTSGGEDILNSGNSFNSDGFTWQTENNFMPTGSNYVSWTFRNAPNFFEAVEYSGAPSAVTVNHNLESIPGCIIFKRYDGSGAWFVYHKDTSSGKHLVLNTSAGETDDGGSPFSSLTSTSFTFDRTYVNDLDSNGNNYVAYLFAEDEDNIKCGSFNGTAGTTVNVGFEPQWVILKRTDGGDWWYCLDNKRGLPTADSTDSTGIFLNSNYAESSSYNEPRIYTTATGFTVSTGTGLNPNPYIYIAIKKED